MYGSGFLDPDPTHLPTIVYKNNYLINKAWAPPLRLYKIFYVELDNGLNIKKNWLPRPAYFGSSAEP
jgi:hypothetical protein